MSEATPTESQIDSLRIMGIRLVGVNAEVGHKLLLTLALVVLVVLLKKLLLGLVGHLRSVGASERVERVRFWLRQGIHVVTTVFAVLGVLSIWFDDPGRLTTAVGLVTAGLAFALQKVVTALAGYIVILNGRTFGVGDRITMGGVRGDVMALGFLQTTIMEMGQPPEMEDADPAMWVRSRQYTGRIVTVSNAKIFDEPVYNYTRDFPFIWEEIRLPVTFTADRPRAEAILLDAARRHTVQISDLGEEALRALLHRYFMKREDLHPRVYYRITSNWVELTVRFLSPEHEIRELKDRMSRDILAALEKAGISVASTTFEIVGLPPLRVRSPGALGVVQ